MRSLRGLFKHWFVRQHSCVSNRVECASKWVFPAINRIMSEKKPFLNPNFDLHNLCEMVGTNRTYISASFRINNTSFVELVSKYRGDYIKELLELTPDKYDMDDLAMLSGFPSKRTMIANLKRYSPELYRRLRYTVKK